ncbi:ABC transporter substrate-binding protein [Paracoccus sp. S-4012]|uniref:TRAP transporter substrate-binding protein DctP n=1 Tax=Paracoccus sp. S-4012 TaxID=2665648 RepID=UPI0012AFB1F7|nr:TRAP transporter substrate-binding protein DctP [Paracoccus sp. S-4012]MRX51955.1 ABC transporter substrate-binding protein [Paracoccus sp. S-4012]
MTIKLTAGAALALALMAGTASAQETVLRAVSAFQLDTAIAEPFNAWVERVNEAGEGILRIEVIGGPETMPPFEVGNALRGGVVDLANTTAVYHANLVPEGLAMTLTDKKMPELRENGGYQLLDDIHMRKAGIHWLGRLSEGMKYYIYLAKEPTDLKFEGLNIRSAPTYQAFFTALGINPMQTAAGEVFTALERGTIDGYAWPSRGVFDLGWQEKTAARVEPGFYQVETGVYLSARSWENLGEPQKQFLQEQMLAWEADGADLTAAAEAELQQQAEAGIATVTLPEDEAAAFLALSIEEGWKPVVAANPEEGAKLRELYSE